MSWDFLKTEWAYFTGAFVTIFFVVDPFAVVPLYLAISKRFDKSDQFAIRLKSTLIATLILIAFAVSGMRFFQLFGITLPAFQIGGGILLLSLGVKQLDSERKRVGADEEDESFERDNIIIFPLAMPLLAGPAAISTVILYATSDPSLLRLSELVAAILAVMVLSYIVLSFSPLLLRVLGKTGLNIMTRLMGLVLTAVAVQFVVNGISEVVRQFGKS